MSVTTRARAPVAQGRPHGASMPSTSAPRNSSSGRYTQGIPRFFRFRPPASVLKTSGGPQ